MKTHKCLLITQALAFILTTFLLATSVMAQGFGIKGGLVYSGQAYEYNVPSLDLDRLRQTGLMAGIFVSYEVPFLSEIRFEFDYVQKGSGIEIIFTDEQYVGGYNRRTIEDRVDYISINFLATPKLPFSRTISPYLIAGPRTDILIGTSAEFPSPVLDDLNPAVFGVTVGLGFNIPLNSSTSLLLETVYNHDFTYAYDKGVLTVKNNSFQFTTGLSF
jgi:hypothetical protein